MYLPFHVMVWSILCSYCKGAFRASPTNSSFHVENRLHGFWQFDILLSFIKVGKSRVIEEIYYNVVSAPWSCLMGKMKKNLLTIDKQGSG